MKNDNLQNIRNHQKNKSQSTHLINKIKNIPGFIGRLGDMGRVNQKYDIPITAAAKGKLENIIVENLQAAESCIEIIKKNKLKRTSFLILNEISSQKIKKHPDYIYCIDLIECDEKYKKFFEFTLRDTILCKDFTEAQKVSFGKQRNRTVTYKGELIEKSGLISRNKIFGSMNTSQGTEKLEKEIERIKNALKKMKSLLLEREEKIIEFPEILQYESIKKFNFIIENELKRNIQYFCEESNFNNFQEIFENIMNDKEKINSLKEKNKEIINLDEKIILLKNQIQENEIEIKNLTENKIKTAECELQYFNEQSETIYQRNQDIEDKKLIFLGKNFENKIKEHKEMKESVEKNILKFENKKEENKIFFDENHKKLLSLETEFEEMQDRIKNILEEVNHLKKITDEIMQKELMIKNKIKKNNEIINKKREKKDFSAEKRELERIGFKFDESNKKIDSKGNKEEISKFSNSELEKKIENCKETLKNTKSEKEVNFNLLHEFKKKSTEFLTIKNEYDLIKTRFDKKISELSDLKNERFNLFMTGFEKINKYLKYFYQKITFGGNAELEMVDISDPFEGINLSVMPPKKTWKKIGSLSGGEKTLASLSLVFALHKFSPSPFYILDEIDAALDYKNVSLIAQLIREIKAQFIIISLRHNMFEKAERLIGAYKIDGCTKLMAFDQNEFSS